MTCQLLMPNQTSDRNGERPERDRSPTNILLVDTSPSSSWAAKALRDAGCEVEILDHLGGLSPLLERQRFDIVLCRIGQRSRIGIRACQYIKSDPELGGTAVLLLAQDAPPSALLECLDAGADDLVADELSPQALVHRIRTALGRKSEEARSAGLDADRPPVRAGVGEPMPGPQATSRFLRSALEDICHLRERLRDGETCRKELTAQLCVARAKVKELTTVDPSTGLLNRTGLERTLAVEVQRAKRNGSVLIALLLKLSGLKRIAGSLGHSSGDVALKEVRKILWSALRSTDYVGRLGEDELLILLPDVRLAEGDRVAEKLRLRLSDSPLELSSSSLQLEPEVTVIEVSPETASISDLLTRAASTRPTGTTSPQGRAQKSTAAITEQLRSGEGIRAVCQPILRLADESVDGYELLARGPAGPFENPMDFLRVAFEENILQLVDRHCLKACVAAAAVIDKGVRYHVNLFPATLLETSPQALLSMFPTPASGGRYCVEVSEQQILGDPSYLSESIRALRDAGIGIAIDDVGFGRSCLESLVLLEPDIVKIDRKYVGGVSQDRGKARSLKRLLSVAESLGAEVVAEGIEMREDLDALRQLGIKFGQGFLWGRPAAP